MDTLIELPQFLSISMAAKLCGMSVKTFRHAYLYSRVIQTTSALWRPEGTGRQYIIRAYLEKALGRKFTLEECQAADARLEKRRAWQRRYAAAHRPPRRPRIIPGWVKARLIQEGRWRGQA